jgi:hypothetical protein
MTVSTVIYKEALRRIRVAGDNFIEVFITKIWCDLTSPLYAIIKL